MKFLFSKLSKSRLDQELSPQKLAYVGVNPNLLTDIQKQNVRDNKYFIFGEAARFLLIKNDH